MEDVEAPEDETQKPAQAWRTGTSGMADIKLPQKILVDILYAGGH